MILLFGDDNMCDQRIFHNCTSLTMPNTSPPLRQLTLLKFSGEDASSFLQGQLTNDINALDGKWQFSGYCNPKGRLLALFQLWQHGEHIYGLLHSSLVEPTVKRLRMYVMRSKVSIEVHDDIEVSYQLSTPQAKFTAKSEGDTHTLSYDSRHLLIRVNCEEPQSSYSEQWTSLNIAEGIPDITDKTVELFVPQMINLDVLGGINFKKGCYTGQEIVARMHYLGKLKQRMYLCSVTDNCNTGAKIKNEEKSVGNIVCCSGNQALAVLRTEFVSQNESVDLTVENDDGKKIRLSVNDTQPYSLELKT